MIGIPLVMICYLLVIISYFTVMNTGVMIAAPAVAVVSNFCHNSSMNIISTKFYYRYHYTVDPVTNDLASARQKKSLVTESRWSQE